MRIFFARDEQGLREIAHHPGAMNNPRAIILRPIVAGWAVCLTDGRELMRFRGPGARQRALRYLHAQLV